MPVMTEEPKKDRHKKKPFQLRLHPLLRQQLKLLAERNASDMTSEIATAIRERLERANLWPPPPAPEPPGDPRAHQEAGRRQRGVKGTGSRKGAKRRRPGGAPHPPGRLNRNTNGTNIMSISDDRQGGPYPDPESRPPDQPPAVKDGTARPRRESEVGRA